MHLLAECDCLSLGDVQTLLERADGPDRDEYYVTLLEYRNRRFGGETDVYAQQEWYQAFTRALLRRPFVRGTGWWDWSATRLYPAAYGPDHNGYCTYGKPANDTLRRFSAAVGK